ncbi:hypothetical protein HQ576_06180, partial [bacterium]|nr:hypothetical protein [bacterium]
SSRMMFDVPSDHIGDGQWHRGRMAYDFTSDEKAKWVHFGARIIGKAGELLLDDVSYVEKVGPLLAIRALHVVEDEKQPGRKCLVKVSVKNTGDEPARNVQVAFTVPAGLKATPPSAAVGNLGPRADAWTRMTLDGPRDAAGALKAVATSGTLSAQATRKLEPKLSIVSFGPKHPVADVGTPAVLQCVLKNDGNANVRDVRAVFTQPGGQKTVGAKVVAPGRSVILECPVPTAKPLAGAPVSVAVRAGNVDGVLGADSRLVVAPPAFAPPPQPKGVAVGQVAAADGFAFIGNEHLCLTFRRGEAGFGPAWLFVRREGKWARAACLPRLSRIVARATAKGRWEPAIAVTERPATRRDNRTLHLACRWQQKDAEGGEWTLSAAFALKEGEKSIGVDYQLACSQPRELLAFDGPMLYALHRDEAVFPGLEWLVDDEVSSSTLDIQEGHPHQKRFVVHPNLVTIPAIGVHGKHGTVGLLWDMHQKWDGTQGRGTGARPSALFASPDRLHNQRAHLMGLFLPTVPDFVEANTTEAAKPYPLKAGQTLRLRCRLFADGGAADSLAAMDEWIRLHGWAEPTPLPHGSYEREVEFSMQGYLKSLWEAESQEWWSSKGGSPKMCKLGRHRAYVADCLLGALLSSDEAVREQCRARAGEVLAHIGGEARLDAHRFPGRADHSYARTGLAAVLLNSVGDDGGWRFNAERRGTSVFEGIDYHVLGPHDALELGTCARNAFEVLRYARIAGEPRAYAGMRKSLELMESFRVPRAAQVWEVPVHAPDILAAADAVSAYIEAYRFSGDARWLKDAVTWARRGLPFVYLWGLPEKPYLLGGSIAVFGATFHRGSWFGRPVQWNGLRYANAVLKLAEHDRSYPWRRIAELIIHSAIHQQDLEGENVALWPDNIDAVTDKKCPWVFAPRQIIRNILKLTGRDEDPATVMLGAAPNRVHITATATITDATWQGDRLAFRAVYRAGEQGVVLVSNVARPAAVLLAGMPIAERHDVETGAEPGWRYDDADGFLSIRIASDG